MVIVLSNRDCLVYHWFYSGRNNNMNDKDKKIKELESQLKYYKENSILICGSGSEDDEDGEQAKNLGVRDNETFFDFDAEGFVDAR